MRFGKRLPGKQHHKNQTNVRFKDELRSSYRIVSESVDLLDLALKGY